MTLSLKERHARLLRGQGAHLAHVCEAPCWLLERRFNLARRPALCHGALRLALRRPVGRSGPTAACSHGIFPFPASAPLPLQDATPDFHWPMYYECLALVRGECPPTAVAHQYDVRPAALLTCSHLQRRGAAWGTWGWGRRISATPIRTSSQRAWHGSMGEPSERRVASWAA